MTTVWLTLTFLVIVLLGLSLVVLILSHLAAVSHFTRASEVPKLELVPKVSVLKPVEGTNEATYEAFASFCRLEYTGEYELLVGTLDRGDPIVSVVERLQREFPERKIRLVWAELQGANRKTSIMEALWREAEGDALFFSDADVIAAPDYLEQLVPRLCQPGVGCLTCLPCGVRARTVGGRLIALHYGFSYLPQWMLALWTTGVEWAIGHTMAVPREVMERLGGFRGFFDHLADDYELGHRTTRLGLRVTVPPVLLDCVMPEETGWAAFRRMQRWKRTIRGARGDLAFLGVGLTVPLFWAVVLVMLQPVSWWSWSVLAIVVLIRWLAAWGVQFWVRLPDWSRSWWLLPLLDMMEGLTFMGAYLGRTVVWAGRRYRLLADGTLALEDQGRAS